MFHIYKHLTKDCPGCEYHGTEGSKEMCYWSRPLKLIPWPRMRKCAYISKPSPRKLLEEELVEERRLREAWERIHVRVQIYDPHTVPNIIGGRDFEEYRVMEIEIDSCSA